MKKIVLTCFIAFIPICFFGAIYSAENEKKLSKVDELNKVGSKTISFFDRTRSRPLITYILYPAQSTVKELPSLDATWIVPPIAKNASLKDNLVKAPLILLSHGNGGSRLDSSWLMHALAQKGYIVVSVDHYANTWYYNEPDEATVRWERAKDISFVIRELIQQSEFKDKIDQDKIGFIGFSLGGLTGIWLAGGQANLITDAIQDERLSKEIDINLAKKSYHDPLIKAEFLMAPSDSFIFDEASLKNISIPIYLVAGQIDMVVPIANSKYLAQWIPKSKLKILPGKIGHFVFVNEISPAGQKFLPSYITKGDRYFDKKQLHEEISQEAIQFFNTNL